MSPAALLAYALAILAASRLEGWLQGRDAGSALQRWMAERLYLPLARFGALAALVTAAGPDLLGRPDLDLPPLGAVLAAQEAPWRDLQALATVSAVLLPLLPGVARHAALLLGVQTVALTALLARWTATASGAPALELLPPLETIGVLVALAVGAELLGRAAYGLVTDLDPDPLRERLVYHLTALAIQAPVAIVYGRALGATLA